MIYPTPKKGQNFEKIIETDTSIAPNTVTI